MIARTDDYNSTINFPKILFLSFFDRPRSTRPFFSFFSPFSPSSTLSLSRGKIYSLLSPIARRFCFPGRSSKGKKVSTLDRCAAYRFFFIRPLFFLLFSAVQKKKKERRRKEKKRIEDHIALWSMFRADFSTLLFLYSSRNYLNYLSSVPGMAPGRNVGSDVRRVIRHRYNSAEGTSQPGRMSN